MRPDSSTRCRTITKGFSFEVVSNLVGLGITYMWFGNWGNCLLFTGVCFIVKLTLFYFHERAWHQIPYGKRM